jgi:hypothetical protein
MKLRDVWKVYNLKSIGEMNDEERKKYGEILENWYTNKIHPECMCKEKHPYPRLHVKKSSAGNYFLANNPNSNRGEQAHEFQCQLNLLNEGYRGYLKQRGIVINEEGEIICSLKKKKKKPDEGSEKGNSTSGKERGSRMAPSIPAAGENALRYLFLTWLQEALIHEYRPGQQRNLRGRLLRIMAKTKVDSIKLSADNVYIANSNFKFNFAKHRIVVAWGSKISNPASVSPTHPFLMNIPIFSLDDRQEKVQDISLHKSVFDYATLTTRNVDSGYWVLYRNENESGKLVDTELIFEPADPITGIPVESAYEEEMVHFLLDNGRYFKKPLIGNVTELFLDQRPDMVLFDTKPKTIIEVAGYQDEKYRSNLAKKKDTYERRGYQYIEWDGWTSIQSVKLPAIQSI